MPSKTSSVSKGTRKKIEAKRQARQADEDPNDDASQQQKQSKHVKGQAAKGQRGKKAKKNEPKKKQYVPPPKPPKGAVDPVDMHGLASMLDPQLVITLRKFMKKDYKTLGKALDEFSAFLAVALENIDEHLGSVISSLPVWLHHFPKFALHTDKRIRQSAASVQNVLVQSQEDIRDVLVTAETHVLAAWIMLAFDMDRSIRLMAQPSWNSAASQSNPSHVDFESVTQDLGSCLLSYVENHPDDASNAAQASDDEKQPHPPPFLSTPVASTASDLPQLEEDPLTRQTRDLVGALDALAWLVEHPHSTSKELQDALLHCSAWDLLRPRSESLPPARKSAWALLSAMLRQDIDFSQDQMGSIAQALFGAFEEDDAGVQSVMWNGLLLLLRKHPDSWLLAEEGSDESDSEDEEGEDAQAKGDSKGQDDMPAVIKSLLGFISDRCPLQPAQNYPGIILLIASIPPPFFTFIDSPARSQSLFDAFWACTSPSQPMIDSLFECMLYVVKRTSDDILASQLASHQVRLAWSLFLQRASIGDIIDLVGLASALQKLHSYNPAFLDDSWREVAKLTESALDENKLSEVGQGLAKLAEHSASNEMLRTRVDACLNTVFVAASSKLAANTDHQTAARCLEALDAAWVPCRTFLSAQTLQAFDETVMAAVPRCILEQPDLAPPAIQLFENYVVARGNITLVNELWSSVFPCLPAADSSVARQVTEKFVRLAQAQKLPDGLQHAHADDMLKSRIESQLLRGSSQGSDSAEINLIVSLLQHPSPFLDATTAPAIISSLVDQTAQLVDHKLRTADGDVDGSLGSQMALLAAYLKGQSALQSLMDMQTLVPILITAFKATFLLGSQASAQVHSQAAMIWNSFQECAPHVRDEVVDIVRVYCQQALADVNMNISPFDLVSSVSELDSRDGLGAILPTRQQLTGLRQEALQGKALATALAIFKYEAHPKSFQNLRSTSRQTSGYVRSVLAAAQVLLQDRTHCKPRTDLLADFALLRVVCKTELLEPGAEADLLGSGQSTVDVEATHALSNVVIGLLLSKSDSEPTMEWHKKLLQLLQQPATEPADGVAGALQELWQAANEISAGAALLLKEACASILSTLIEECDQPSEAAEEWLKYGRTLHKSDPERAALIFAFCTPLLEGSPFIQRVRLQFASDLSGVKVAEANTDGERLLRLLLALAPGPQSSDELLPQQRAVFVVKALQGWLLEETDEDLDEPVIQHLLRLLDTLAPTLQDVQGTHWEFGMDLCDEVIESLDWRSHSSLASLWHASSYLRTVESLMPANSDLKQAISNRVNAALKGIFSIITQAGDRDHSSRAQGLVVQQIAGLLHDYNPKISMADGKMTSLVNLMSDSTHWTRIVAYELAQKVAEEDIKRLIVEMELATSDLEQAYLPGALVSRLSSYDEENLEPFLLAWQLVLQVVDVSSASVRSALVDQLRQEEVVSRVLLPALIQRLGVTNRVGVSAIQVWDVSSIELDATDFSSTKETLHAGHIFFRVLECLPSLARAWLEETKDRQLSNAFVAFVSRQFSPILISRELKPLKEEQQATKKPSPMDEDPMNIKVSSTVNEIRAVYNIDDQALELTIRLPSDYPLSPIEIRDSKRIGVSENTWRAWMFAVQQTISGGNARIADALSLFKRNITLHFEGVEPCAICYSVISLADRRLPTKKCRTCKNIFHASCLFKWFSTSHGSSCPLCRSLF